ncbi:MAG TPA: hypothetical protein VIG06_06090, partial [Kofleriaceae bacterium]
DARQVVAATRGSGTSVAIEERMRAALAALHAIYSARQVGTRCSEPVRWYRRQAVVNGSQSPAVVAWG